VFRPLSVIPVLVASAIAAGCSANANGDPSAPAAAAAVQVATAVAESVPLTRYIAVSGTLAAQESAEVAAETAGRIVATPVERGSRVGANADLVRISATEVEAQAREAEANAAQIAARLGISGGAAFDVTRVPEVANADANRRLARTEFARAETLHKSQLISQSEYEQKSAQLESAERQYDVAANGAEQQYQSLMAARARMNLAQKAVADTVVRAPFPGLVGERFVSVGDYVTKGTKVASVMRVDPLRIELTVPAQYVSQVAAGRSVNFVVDSYPGEIFTGQVRYVSPSVDTATRALTLEAVVPNPDGRLKPGFFATARIEEAGDTPGIVVPAAAVRTMAGTARVFVIAADRAEERIVMTGQADGDRVEITDGLRAGERVATSGVERLADGAHVSAR
jgi:RND family efflux transporter MFP subunit